MMLLAIHSHHASWGGVLVLMAGVIAFLVLRLLGYTTKAARIARVVVIAVAIIFIRQYGGFPESRLESEAEPESRPTIPAETPKVESSDSPRFNDMISKALANFATPAPVQVEAATPVAKPTPTASPSPLPLLERPDKKP